MPQRLRDQTSQIVTPAPLDLDGVVRLLNVLADGRAFYALGYPEGDGKTYLDTQVATLRTVARVFTDRTLTNAGLFLPTHMEGIYTDLLADLGVDLGPDQQTLSDVKLLYRQAYPTAPSTEKETP